VALKLDILANTRDFVQNMKRAGASVEDVSDELDDMAREGATAGEKVERSFKEIATSADKAGDKMKRSLKEPFDEAKREAGQIGRETAASFSGGLEDVADAAQETLANAFAGFGPIGAAAGIAIAAAIGAALQGASDLQERLAEARSRAGELAQTLYDNQGKLPMEDAVSRLLELLPSERGAGNPFESFLNQWIDLGTNIDAVRAAAKSAKAPVDLFIDGLSGADMDATAEALEAVEKAIDRTREKAKGELNFENGAAIAQLSALQSSLKSVQTETELATELYGTMGERLDAAAQVEQIERIGEAWQNAMVDASEYVKEAEGTTTFDWSAYLADAEATLAAANEYKRKILTTPDEIRAEAERLFEEQGAQAANAYLDSFDAATSADKARFISAAVQNGADAGKAQGKAMATEAERAAQAKAQGWGTLQMPVRANLDDSAVRNYRPPVINFKARIIREGPGWREVPWV
jgi:hypothetical protein